MGLERQYQIESTETTTLDGAPEKIYHSREAFVLPNPILHRLRRIVQTAIYKFLVGHNLVITGESNLVRLRLPWSESQADGLITGVIGQLRTNINDQVAVESNDWVSLRLRACVKRLLMLQFLRIANSTVTGAEWDTWSNLPEVREGWVSAPEGLDGLNAEEDIAEEEVKCNHIQLGCDQLDGDQRELLNLALSSSQEAGVTVTQSREGRVMFGVHPEAEVGEPFNLLEKDGMPRTARMFLRLRN